MHSVPGRQGFETFEKRMAGIGCGAVGGAYLTCVADRGGAIRRRPVTEGTMLSHSFNDEIDRSNAFTAALIAGWAFLLLAAVGSPALSTGHRVEVASATVQHSVATAPAIRHTL